MENLWLPLSKNDALVIVKCNGSIARGAMADCCEVYLPFIL